MRGSFWSRHRWLKWIALSCLAALIALTVATVTAAHRAEPFLRALIVAKLEQRFHARVELASFHVSIAHGLRAEGKGLRIWPPAQEASAAIPASGAPGKPLIQIDDFRFRAPLHYTRGKPIRISRVEVRGLTVDIPPRQHFLHVAAAAPAGNPPIQAPPGADLLRLQVESVQCNDAHVLIENRDPAKPPLEFDIQTLKATLARSGDSMNYEATLTNPRPRGLIVTKGSFGPWALPDPGMTPLQGSYTFRHADLSTFKGISGILSSTGRYSGALRDMTVDGVTDTPNFALTHFGATLPLHTVFHAKVDSTNGDTWLEPVNATLGQSDFVAQGKVVELRAVPAANGKPARRGGHEIDLNVDIEHGQIADFLRLVSHRGNAFLTGTLHMKTTLKIPPGGNPVQDRLQLRGAFQLEGAQFTSQKLQDRIGDLSLRGQGKPKQAKSAAAAAVRSTMASNFTMDQGLVTLPNLQYSVPGAQIDLKGTYDVDGGGLDFNGTARMQATVSQMLGGWKGALLKPVDRFFKKDGAGTRVRVHVYGTRQDPQFGVDF